jgi:hypothetical protein
MSVRDAGLRDGDATRILDTNAPELLGLTERSPDTDAQAVK